MLIFCAFASAKAETLALTTHPELGAPRVSLHVTLPTVSLRATALVAASKMPESMAPAGAVMASGPPWMVNVRVVTALVAADAGSTDVVIESMLIVAAAAKKNRGRIDLEPINNIGFPSFDISVTFRMERRSRNVVPDQNLSDFIYAA